MSWRGRWSGAALLMLVATSRAAAHSASDAYLSLTVEREKPDGAARVLIHGQWDIALRDLDFVLHLDENGDGRLTWNEVRRRRAAIERYAYDSLHLGAPGSACTIRPLRLMIDEHADGAYAALFFEALCPQAAVQKLRLDYRLFFSVDPSHRGILVMRSGTDIATAALSPQNASIELRP